MLFLPKNLLFLLVRHTQTAHDFSSFKADSDITTIVPFVGCARMQLVCNNLCKYAISMQCFCPALVVSHTRSSQRHSSSKWRSSRYPATARWRTTSWHSADPSPGYAGSHQRLHVFLYTCCWGWSSWFGFYWRHFADQGLWKNRFPTRYKQFISHSNVLTGCTATVATKYLITDVKVKYVVFNLVCSVHVCIYTEQHQWLMSFEPCCLALCL